MPSELGRLLMPAIHSTFLSAHPDVDLDLTLLDHHVELISEGYDVIFRVGSLVDSTLKARTLARMSMVLVASPSFVCAHGDPASVDDLRRMPFARYQLNGRTLPIVFENGEALMPHGRVGLDSGFGLRAAALEGMGVAYVMRCTVQQDLENGKLVELLREHPLPTLALHAVHAFADITPVRVKIFADFIRSEVRGWL
jgi:DNA-binding transcriptional LysR family regulator